MTRYLTKAQPSQPEQNANENSLSAEAPASRSVQSLNTLDKPYVAVNGNVDVFHREELTDRSYQFYQRSRRPDVAARMRSIGQDLMPTKVARFHWHGKAYRMAYRAL